MATSVKTTSPNPYLPETSNHASGSKRNSNLNGIQKISENSAETLRNQGSAFPLKVSIEPEEACKFFEVYPARITITRHPQQTRYTPIPPTTRTYLPDRNSSPNQFLSPTRTPQNYETTTGLGNPSNPQRRVIRAERRELTPPPQNTSHFYSSSIVHPTTPDYNRRIVVNRPTENYQRPVDSQPAQHDPNRNRLILTKEDPSRGSSVPANQERSDQRLIVREDGEDLKSSSYTPLQQSPESKPTMVTSTVYYHSPAKDSPTKYTTVHRKPKATSSSVLVESRMMETPTRPNKRSKATAAQVQVEERKLDVNTSYPEHSPIPPSKNEKQPPEPQKPLPAPQRGQTNLDRRRKSQAMVPTHKPPLTSENRESALDSERFAAFQEIRETLIHDPVTYFKTSASFSYDVPEEFSKIEADHDNRFVYLAGVRGITKHKVAQGNLEPTGQKFSEGSVATKIIPNGKIVSQRISDCSVMNLDPNLVELKRGPASPLQEDNGNLVSSSQV